MSDDELSDVEVEIDAEEEEEQLYRDKGNWIYETMEEDELYTQIDELLKHYVSRKDNRAVIIQELRRYDKELCMQILFDFIPTIIEHGVKEAFSQLTEGKIGWNNPIYESIKLAEEKEVNKRLKPITIEEGIYTCKKCGGKRTQSYEVQLRRADEPATVFVECVNPKCRNKWSMG
jgi:DNA-directed RNA polymerase subunit M/transcription elongation factor TFIIS